MTACAAKFCSSSICFFDNGPGNTREMLSDPMAVLPRIMGTIVTARNPPARKFFAPSARSTGGSSTSGTSIILPSMMATEFMYSRRRGMGSRRRKASARAGSTSAMAPATTLSPSGRRIATAASPNSSRPLRTIASNTGCISVSELLMTFSTSEVAVCCSSASVSSVVRFCTSSNNRTLSIAITA
jgi:hypothetical protein